MPKTQTHCKSSKKKISASKVLLFSNRMDERNFEKVSYKKKLTETVSKGLKKPKRATIENALQSEYRSPSWTGYTAKALTATINGKFNPRGTSWAHVENEKGELVWTREFYKIKGLLTERLMPYAIVAQNIADNRPPNMNLVRTSETTYAWKTKSSKKGKIFRIEDYFMGLTDEEKAFVIGHEKKRDAYLKRTEGKVTRQEDLQKTWKS